MKHAPESEEYEQNVARSGSFCELGLQRKGSSKLAAPSTYVACQEEFVVLYL